MDPTWIDLALAVGLTARATRLAVVDDIADPARVAVVRTAGRVSSWLAGWTAGLLSCPFCIGWWIAVTVAGAWHYAGHTAVYQVVAVAGTLSYVAGHAVAHLDMNGGDDG